MKLNLFVPGEGEVSELLQPFADNGGGDDSRRSRTTSSHLLW
jgi:hypothetical protein